MLTVIVLSYGLHITVVSYALYALRQVTVIPDGFLLAYGTPVVATRQGRGAVVDVAPTLLYFLGLPVARDMDGFARTDLFTPPFNEQRTITFIPTYGVQ